MSHTAKLPRALFSTILTALALSSLPQQARAQAQLIVTEIHYHSEVDDQEFVEVKNVGDEAVNFTGWEVGGIGDISLVDAVIAPGGFMVLAEDSATFQAAYGFAADGSYAGSLKNSGEEVDIKDSLGNVVFSVDYWDGGAADPPMAPDFEDQSDRPNWPTDPDGKGRSLVPMDPNVNPDPDDYRNWRPSINDGGSPGADEPLPSPLLPIFINEIRTRDGDNANDAIELFNPNAVEVPIGDWFLTDDVDDPDESPIPPGTVVPAGEYLVLANGVDGFALSLSSQGEAVFLYSADALGNSTGFVNGLYFNASADGKTFSRYVNSVGAEQFPAAENTLGLPNVTPNVGPVVITEIMYNPTTLAGDDEFIEIKNISGSTVLLYDPLNEGNNWRVEGVNFILNGDKPSLDAGEIAIVSQTDPADFRLAHPGIPLDMQIFGPYPDSSLSNGGEEVALQRPVNLDDDDANRTSYINVDVVLYDNSAPWPTQADAGGRSLVRIDPEVYGNDPNNWKASFLPNGSAGIIYNYTGPEILVNEVLSHSDLPLTDVIELLNPTMDAVNIGGWFLTDDKNDPKKFTIPNGTMIASGGFWAVNQDNDAAPGAPANYFGNSFQISSRGDEIYLYSADAGGNLTGYRHGWQFRATVNGSVANGSQTLGRYVDSLGREHFTKQVRSFERNISIPNPDGFANTSPLVGPVIITEINAEPGPGGVEFIELKNISNQTVALYDNSFPNGDPSNNWSIDGVTFTFPGVQPTAPAGSVIVILPLNTDVEAFREASNVPEEAIVIGGTDGYVGALNNGGEELVLLRPDKPDTVDNVVIVPLIVVDLINYNDVEQWPVTEGGFSLEKTNSAGFSDDPANWDASIEVGGTPGIAEDRVEESYDTWAADNFTPAELENPALSDCDADVNGDGVANVNAYAFGYDPHITPSGNLLPQAAIVEDGGSDFLAITFRRRIVAPDLTFEIDSSTDLSAWLTIAGQQVGEAVDNGDGTETVQVRTTTSTTAEDRSFLRVKVTKG